VRFLRHQALAWLSRLLGQGKDVGEEGKAGRSLASTGAVQDGVKLRAPPAALGSLHKALGEAGRAGGG